MIETSSPGHLSPTASLVLMALTLLALAIALGWALHGWRTQSRLAVEALARVITGSPPARGSVVLRGVVETAEPDRPAITVTLWESGVERKTKNGWEHTWTEQRREVRVEPFDLWLKGGVVVRVEPDDDVFLVDALDALERGNPRVRRAELTNGETACVSGIIGTGRHARVHPEPSADAGARGSAYRDGPMEGPVLRSGRSRMLVSTEPLDKRHLRPAKVHRLYSALIGVALLLASTFLFGPALVTEMFGRTTDATILTGRHWTTAAKRGVDHHYAVTARFTDASGRNVDAIYPVRGEVYDAWVAKRIHRLPVTVAFDNPTFSNLGSRAALPGSHGILGGIAAAALLVFYAMALGRARAWYDKDRVVTHGAGPIVL